MQTTTEATEATANVRDELARLALMAAELSREIAKVAAKVPTVD